MSDRARPAPQAAVDATRHGDVLQLQLCNPPVNGMGHELRLALHAALAAALADTRVRALAICGAGGIFCGGADIRQFNTPRATAWPMLRDINTLIESSPKPVVAAIEGHALGAGLELAMACHFRVAAVGAHLALPEVRLGIVPGGGGTQRLPRLVGLHQAADMILSGDALSADQALSTGLVDRLATAPALLETARAMARDAAGASPDALTRTRLRRFDARDDGIARHQALDFLAGRRRQALLQAPDDPAPLAALDCLEAALSMDFEDALSFERTQTQRLAQSPLAAAKRARFFAERASRRGAPPDHASV